MVETKWLLCPSCHGKTRTKLRKDTILIRFLLFCPKCKKEMLINVNSYRAEVIDEK